MAGPIGNLSMNVLTSPPGLSELDALAAIFGGGALEALLRGAPIGSVFQDQIGQLLLGFALPGLFQPVEIGGISLALEPGFDVPLQISAGTQLNDKMTLSYSRSIAGRSPLDTFAFGYIISRQLGLAIEFQGLNGAVQETTALVQYYKRF